MASILRKTITNKEGKKITRSYIRISNGKDPLTKKRIEQYYSIKSIQGNEIIIDENSNKSYDFGSKARLSEWVKIYNSLYFSSNLEASKIYSMERNIEKVINVIGDKPLCYIERSDSRKLIDELSPLFSISYVSSIYKSFRTLMKRAYLNGYIRFDPCDGIKAPKEKEHYFEPFTKEEIKRFCEYANESEFKSPILLMLFTGLRISECLGLTWNNVDFDESRLRINQQLNRNDELVLRTKNGMKTWIYVPNIAISILKEIENDSISNQKRKRKFVFVDSNGNPLNRTRLRKTISMIGDKLGRYRLRAHDLRHEASSVMEEVSNDIYASKTMLRHKNVSTTIRYTHVSPDRMKTIASTVDNYYKDLLETNDEKNSN